MSATPRMDLRHDRMVKEGNTTWKRLKELSEAGMG
jgi:hypothetical protein